MKVPIIKKKTNIIFFSHTPPFLLQKNSLKRLNFRIFLPLKELLVATFSKGCALTSRKYVSKSDIRIPNLLDKKALVVTFN